MSERKNDGGPAFPHSSEWVDAHGNVVSQEPGMTLRDYFAAKAMQGILAGITNADDDQLAQFAYASADSMLRAREAGQ